MLIRFKSFIHLLEYCQVDHEKLSISQIKKVLLAELAQSENGFIEVKDVVYNKQEILDWLNSDQAETILAYHKEISKHIFLLSFLESDYFDFSEVSWYNLSDSEEFVAYISPYYGYAYKHCLGNYLHKGELFNAGNFILFKDFILPVHIEECEAPLRIFLEESKRLLKNVSLANYLQHYVQLRPWLEQHWYVLFNNLPSPLKPYAIELSGYLLSLAVSLQYRDASWTSFIHTQLSHCHGLPSELAEVVNKNERILDGKESDGGGGFSWSMFFRIIGLILLIIKFIAFLLKS